MVAYYWDDRGGGARLPVDSRPANIALSMKTFEDAIDRLGHIAEELDSLAQITTSSVAAIEAQGDRIDRLQADNQVMLDELVNGS